MIDGCLSKLRIPKTLAHFLPDSLIQSFGTQHLDIRTTLRYRRCILTENLESPIVALRRRQREAKPPSPEPTTESEPTPPHHRLFAEPPSVKAVDLPFRESDANWAAGFYRLLKTQIIGRFLGLRRFSRRGS